MVATPGAEPVAEGGYAAVVLLDTWLMLARPDLRTAEEAVRRWANAVGLVRPGGSAVVVGDPALPGLQALVRWDPGGFAAREAAERADAHLPPASRLATITGDPGAVDDALTLLALPDAAEALGPVPVGDDDVRVVLRVPRAQGAALSQALWSSSGCARPASSTPYASRSTRRRCRPDVIAAIGLPRLARVAIQPIRLFGDPVLRQKAVEVVDFDKELRRLVEDLTDTMLDAPGAGLAAPQIGVGLRVFTWNVEGEVGHLVNPVLDLSEDTQDGSEGCLSIPGLSIDCLRAMSVVAKGFDMHGEPVAIEGSELLARALQHETDHLDGVLFLDRLDAANRKLAMKAIRESEWFGLEQPTVKVSPHATVRTRAASASRLRRHAGACPPGARRDRGVAATSWSAWSPGPDAPAGRGRRLTSVPGRRRGPRSSAYPCSSPTTRATRSSRRRCATWRPTAARWSPTAPCSRSPPSTSPPTAGSTCTSPCCPPGAAPPRSSTRCWAGDEVTGATTFRIVRELDAGPTYGLMTERIRPGDTAGALLARLAEGGAGLLVATLDGIEDGSLEARDAARGRRQLRPQDHRRGRPRRLDRAGDGASTAGSAPARPCPAPGRRTRASGSSSARSTPADGWLAPGELLVGKNAVAVGTGTAALRLGQVKAFGKKEMPAADWARGVRVEPGARFE